MGGQPSTVDRILQFFSSLKCGLVLLALLGLAMIAGTFILQRPMAQEGQIEQVYAPQVISILNTLGLFDVFHTWWFILLLGLLGANITLASIERFPQVWRLYARPHLTANVAFVRGLPFQKEVALGKHSAPEALQFTARALRAAGSPPRPDVLRQGTLYVEKHRLARLAPYIVHASLLVIFAGTIVDSTRGYRGFITLRQGANTSDVEPLTTPGAHHHLDFSVRCDAAGMDLYPDGSPRQYWSQLTILENGREVAHKKIYVNDPLTHQGVRFFQATYAASSGAPAKVFMEAAWQADGVNRHQQLVLTPGEPALLGAQGASVALLDFLPDYVLDGNRIASRSDEPRNPAIHLQVTRPGAPPTEAWILAKTPEVAAPNSTGVNFRYSKVEMDAVTGLQVASEPGQWMIWGGCLILTAGLMLALYFSHIRIWGIIASNKQGRPILLLGGQPSKYRENFERKFNELSDRVEAALAEASEPVTVDQSAA